MYSAELADLSTRPPCHVTYELNSWIATGHQGCKYIRFSSSLLHKLREVTLSELVTIGIVACAWRRCVQEQSNWFEPEPAHNSEGMDRINAKTLVFVEQLEHRQKQLEW